MRSAQIVLGVAAVGSFAAAVGNLLTDGWWDALTPAGLAVLFGVASYKTVRNPPQPTRWTRQRIIATAVLFGTASLAMILSMTWVLTVRSEWPIRVIAVVGILLVPTLGFWLVRTARGQREAGAARLK